MLSDQIVPLKELSQAFQKSDIQEPELDISEDSSLLFIL